MKTKHLHKVKNRRTAGNATFFPGIELRRSLSRRGAEAHGSQLSGRYPAWRAVHPGRGHTSVLADFSAAMFWATTQAAAPIAQLMKNAVQGNLSFGAATTAGTQIRRV